MMQTFIPCWPAPPQVRALSTMRPGGASRPPYDGFNLASHVGDDPVCVAKNRAYLRQQLPADPIWLQQNHSAIVIPASQVQGEAPAADAIWSQSVNQLCVVMTADCLPILLCDLVGTQVAAVHAGWRGLASGIIAATLAHFHHPDSAVMAWLGPCIGPTAFTVGEDVFHAFTDIDPNARPAFSAVGPGRWQANLQQLARIQLMHCGIQHIYADPGCTYSDEHRFFSYRRDIETGRMASLIWLTEAPDAIPKHRTPELPYP